MGHSVTKESDVSQHEHTKNRTSKDSDSMFCSRPWTPRLTPDLLAFVEDFDDDALPFPNFMRFAIGGVTVYEFVWHLTFDGVRSTFIVIVGFRVITLLITQLFFGSTRFGLIPH